MKERMLRSVGGRMVGSFFFFNSLFGIWLALAEENV